MDKLKKLIATILAFSLVFSFTGCEADMPDDKAAGNTESGSNLAPKDNADDKRNKEPVGKVELIRSYETKFCEENAIGYPSFIIEYPSNWMVSSAEVTPTNETIILTNERGVEIKYSYIGNVAEGHLGGGSTVAMSRVEVSSVADSQFIPGCVQATDYSALGEFVVAKLKVTGQLNMQTDTDFKNVNGAVSFAVVPETRIGVDDCVRLPYEGEFAFWYSGYISLIAKAPDGQFIAQEEAEVIAILSSFRIAE